MSDMVTENPIALVEAAVEQGADVAVLQKLMDLQERWQKGQSERAFIEALSAMRRELPAIVKNKSASFGAGAAAYKYEDLADIVDQLGPVLGRHGLSFRWHTDTTVPENSAPMVRVSCILSHRDGHSESTALAGPYDTSGKKNPIQSIGSTVTYLQRYTLKAAIGIAAGADDDGAQGPTVTEDLSTESQRERFIDLCEEAESLGVISIAELETSREWVRAKRKSNTVCTAIDTIQKRIKARRKLASKFVEVKEVKEEVVEEAVEEVVEEEEGDTVSERDRGSEILNGMVDQLKLCDPESPVGPAFLPSLRSAMQHLKLNDQYPLVKIRGLANEFDAEKFKLGRGSFDYGEIPGHIAMMGVEYVAGKGEVDLDV